MEPIPCYRGAHLFPYVEFLCKIGAPVERGLCRVKLPPLLDDRPNTYLYLPELATIDFLTQMSQREGIDDLGLRATQHVRVIDCREALVASVYQAPTLLAALEGYRELVGGEDTYVYFWMHAEGDTVKLCSLNRALNKLSVTPVGSRFEDWSQMQTLIALVRAFAGPGWYPEEIALHSEAPLSRLASEHFPHTRILIGQEAASLTVPRTLLSLPPQARPEAAGAWLTSRSEEASGAEPPWDLPGSLRRVLMAYVGDGSPSIELAAELVGTSVRTLQRRLEQAHATYSGLVQQARFAVASELLRTTDMKMIDIAFDVGYEDPSHFSRAFRRLAGLSPRQYRCQHHLNKDFVVPNGRSSGILDTALIA